MRTIQNTGNPIAEAREALGLSRTAFALALGLGYSQVANAENGQLRQIPRAWHPALERLGINAASLDRAYSTWRDVRSAEAFRLVGRSGGTVAGVVA